MVKIVVDSGCDLTDYMKAADGINISVVPLSIGIGEKTYLDDENINIQEYLDEMHASQESPKTSAPSPQAYFEKYETDEKSVFVVTLSSKLSSSYNSAIVAKKVFLEENPEKEVFVFDSVSASCGETIIALKINELSKTITCPTEIAEKTADFISGVKTYFLLERYENAVKTGRMNPYVAKIASLMSLVPICYSDHGKMAVLDKARGYKKAIERLIEIILQDGQTNGTNFEDKVLGISHVKAPEKAAEFKELISAKIKFKDILILETSGLCSTYADEGGIIIAF